MRRKTRITDKGYWEMVGRMKRYCDITYSNERLVLGIAGFYGFWDRSVALSYNRRDIVTYYYIAVHEFAHFLTVDSVKRYDDYEDVANIVAEVVLGFLGYDMTYIDYDYNTYETYNNNKQLIIDAINFINRNIV